MAGMLQTLGQEMAWLDCRHLDLAAELTPQDAPQASPAPGSHLINIWIAPQ